MITPRLWVWAGSPDDKLDVLRYVNATDNDILGQQCVEEVCAEIKKRWRQVCEQQCARADKAKAELAVEKATVLTLKRCVRVMADDAAAAMWTDDDEEMRVLFLRAVVLGDVDTVAAALGVGEE
jgi:hypothetical protein